MNATRKISVGDTLLSPKKLKFLVVSRTGNRFLVQRTVELNESLSGYDFVFRNNRYETFTRAELKHGDTIMKFSGEKLQIIAVYPTFIAAAEIRTVFLPSGEAIGGWTSV